MKTYRKILSLPVPLLTGLIILCSLCPAFAGEETAQPLRKPYATMISFGDEYTSTIELYDVVLTVLEVQRGPADLVLSQETDTETKPPSGDSESLLVKVRFEYTARGAPGNKAYRLRPDQFRLIDAAGEEYPHAGLTVPEPAMDGLLRAPEVHEGWLAYTVHPDRNQLYLVFQEEVGNTIHRSSGLRFQLFE